MLKRKICRFGQVFLVVLILASTILSPSASAYQSWEVYNGYTLNGGVGNYGYTNRYYWIDSTASGYSSLIQSAVNSWIYTSGAPTYISTPISIPQTTTKSQSVFDVYFLPLTGEAAYVYAATFMFVGNVDITNGGNPPTSNWGWSKVMLNNNTTYGFQTITARNNLTKAQNQQGTIAHEFGHAMGLNHPIEVLPNGYTTYHPERIMCQIGSGRTVYTPSVPDLNIINDLY